MADLLDDGDRIPELMLLDSYQTYDLVFAQNLHTGLTNLLFGTKGFPFAGGSYQHQSLGVSCLNSGLLLFERFIPISLPWASDYSLKIAEFYKPLSKSGCMGDKYFSGKGLDANTSFGSMATSAYTPPNWTGGDVLIANQGADSMEISWLQYQFLLDSGSGNRQYYINSLINPVGAIYQRGGTIIPPGGAFVFKSSLVLMGSVVSNKSLVQLGIHPWLWHSNLDSNLSLLSGLVATSFPRLNFFLSGIKYSFNGSIRLLSNRGHPINGSGTNGPDHIGRSLVGSITGYEYSSLPSWYHFCSCILANNNYWQNDTVPNQPAGFKPLALKLNAQGRMEYWVGRVSAPRKRVTQENYETIFSPLTVPNGDRAWYIGELPTAWVAGGWSSRKMEPTFIPTAGQNLVFPYLIAPYYLPYAYAFYQMGYSWRDSYDRTDTYLIEQEQGYPGMLLAPLISSTVSITDTWGLEDPDNPPKLDWYGTVQGTVTYAWGLFKQEISLDRGIMRLTGTSSQIQGGVEFDLTINPFSDAFLGTQVDDPAASYSLPNATLQKVSAVWNPAYDPPPRENKQGGGDKTNSISRQGTVTFIPWGAEPSLPDPEKASDATILDFHSLIWSGDTERQYMTDSIRIKEIHLALDAHKFAFLAEGSNTARVANLGYYVERIARVLGISVSPDGAARSIRQSRHIPQGKKLPAGWPIGQWGRNQGGGKEGQPGGLATEDRDGIAYEVRSNRITADKKTGQPSKIEEGGYVLCENIPQLLHIILDDIDKAIGMQYAGGSAIVSADKQNVLVYEGLHNLLAEALFMLSAISQQTSQGLISSQINQAVLYEILGAFGLPVAVKEFSVQYGDSEEVGKVPFPAIASDSPSVFDLILLILQNIAPLLGSQLKLVEKKEEKK